MTPSVDVVDATGLVASHGAVKELVGAVLVAEGLSGEVTVAFLGEEAVADLNRRYRDAEGPTDVLSFDYCDGGLVDVEWPAQEEDASPRPAGKVGGEMAVCPQVVIRYASEEDREPAVQLGWTLIHGALHLAGYDHDTDQGKMRARERELLEQLGDRVHALALGEDLR